MAKEIMYSTPNMSKKMNINKTSLTAAALRAEVLTYIISRIMNI